MSFIDRRTVCVLTTILVFAGVLAMMWLARRTLIVFLFAILFAYVLEPVVAWFERRSGWSRPRAIAVVYLAALVIVGGTLLVTVPRLVDEGQRAAGVLPGVVSQIGSGKIAWTVGGQHGWSYTTQTRLEHLIAAHRDDIVSAAQSGGTHAAAIGANIGWLFLIPILAIFLLKDKTAFGDALLDQIDSDRQRAFARSVLDDLDRMLAQYIRAQLLLAIFATVAYTVFLFAMRFPYAWVIGATAGVLEFIPFVGPAITAIVIGAVGFFSGYPHWLIVLAFVGVWRVVQDYVNTPYVMSEGLELHPLAAIFGILVGGEIAGIVGMFLSVPVIAALRIVWHHWRLHGALNGTRPRVDELRAVER